MQPFRRLVSFLHPHRGRLVLCALLLLVVGSMRLVFPYAFQLLVDRVLVQKDYDFLNMLAIGLLVLVIIQTFANVVQNYLLSFIGESVVADLRRQLYGHLQALDLRFYTERRVGEITSRVMNDVTSVQSVVTHQLAGFFTEVFMFAGALVLILIINFQLALVMLSVVPPVILVARVFGSRLRKLSTEVQDRLADTSAHLEETVSAVRIVKSFVREPLETSRFNDAIQAAFTAALTRARYRAVFVPIVMLSGFGGMTLVLWYGGRLLLAGEMTQGELSSFLIYTLMIAGSVALFSGVYSQVQESLGALQRIFELLDTEPTVREPATPRAAPIFAGRLHFEDVTFAYEQEPVLRQVTLEVAPGEVLALVGPSGGGKTTLMNLIPRFYDPQSGRVTIDDLDVRELSTADLRAQIGIVPQDTMLFGRSVRENIRYGDLAATDDEIIAAAQAANAHDFILQLPEQYETLVGERGVKLSGGQRQRVAIARTLLKNPRILLLDEATSALDSESEAQVQEALGRLLVGRTTLIIAHRLATIQIADRVAVLDAGRIVELGRHAELLAQGGLYAHLYALQFREEGKG